MGSHENASALRVSIVLLLTSSHKAFSGFDHEKLDQLQTAK